MAQINAEVITDTTVANSKCESLLLEPFVGLDCECVNLGPGGELSLIQVIGSDRKVLLFDVLTCPAIMSGKLRTLLEDQNTLKVRFVAQTLHNFGLYYYNKTLFRIVFGCKLKNSSKIPKLVKLYYLKKSNEKKRKSVKVE